MQSSEKQRQHGKNYMPVHCISWTPIFVQNLKYVGATVIEFSFFNQIKEKEQKKENMDFYKI